MKIGIIAASGLLLLAAVRSVFISGITNNNTFFFAGLALCVFVYGWFFDKLGKMRWLTATIISMFGAVIAFSVFLGIYGSRQTATYDEDFVIVLGAGVRDGEPQPPLRRRLEAAVRYSEENPSAIIIVSGGQGHSEPQSESYVMKQFLVDAGVSPERIRKEYNSTSTYENMLYSMELIARYTEPGQSPSVALITNDFHMFRSMSFARSMGFDARSYPAPTPFGAIWFMYPREVAATVKMWLIGR